MGAENDDTTVSNDDDVIIDEQNDDTNDAQDSTTDNSNDSGDNSSGNSAVDNEARFARLESTMERILGEISSIREAQGILVENGAVISETGADFDLVEEDGFIPPKEMDLLI